MSAPLPADDTAPAYQLRLYVNAGTPTSAQAIVATRRFVERHLGGRYRLEILNIADHVAQAAQDEVIASPTLIRLSPLPVRRFIGTLGDEERLHRSLVVETAR